MNDFSRLHTFALVFSPPGVAMTMMQEEANEKSTRMNWNWTPLARTRRFVNGNGEWGQFIISKRNLWMNEYFFLFISHSSLECVVVVFDSPVGYMWLRKRRKIVFHCYQLRRWLKKSSKITFRARLTRRRESICTNWWGSWNRKWNIKSLRFG